MAVLVAAVTAVGLLSGPGGDAGAAGDFYTPPSKFDDDPGSVIRTQAQSLLLQIPGIGNQWPGDAKRIMYTSTRQNGDPVAVTGTVVEPTAKWRGEGERPTVVIGSGTVGQGDQCASSRMLSFPLSIDPHKLSLGVNYTGLEMYPLLLNGVRVVTTDYIGMGTPGVHTYLNRLESGRAMLDAARAGLSVADAPPDAPVGFSGYSQGGGAAASAAELASAYAPGLNIKGTYAGAPPADLSKLISKIDGTLIAGANAYVINGIAAGYPSAASVLKRQFNRRGRQASKDASTQCIPDTLAAFGFQNTREWTRSGTSLAAVVRDTPVLEKIVDDQRIGRMKPNAPVLISIANNDDVVPAGQVVQLYRDWRAKGADVTLTRDYAPPILPGMVINHGWPMLGKLPSAISFMLGQFNR